MSVRQHLFDRSPTIRRRSTTKALVRVDRVVCPSCAGPIATETICEDALLRHGGHGATRSTTRVACLCGWGLVTEVTETRPPSATSASSLDEVGR